MHFPFYSQGFHCNPFRALELKEWVDIAVLPEPFQNLQSQYTQLLGQKGRGKSTILHKLTAQLLENQHTVTYEYIPEGQHKFHHRIRNNEVYLLDEVQRLSRRQQNRLYRMLGRSPDTRFIFSSHRDMTAAFTAHNLSLISFKLDTMHTHLPEMLHRRLQYFALDNPPRINLTDCAIEFLAQQFGSNHRAIESFLYECFQYIIQYPVSQIDRAFLEQVAPLMLAKIPAQVLYPVAE